MRQCCRLVDISGNSKRKTGALGTLLMDAQSLKLQRIPDLKTSGNCPGQMVEKTQQSPSSKIQSQEFNLTKVVFFFLKALVRLIHVPKCQKNENENCNEATPRTTVIKKLTSSVSGRTAIWE